MFSEARSRDVAMGMWLLFSPYYLELYMGQFSFLMASLLFWSMVAWIKGNVRSGDSFWLVSLVVKSNSVVLAPVLLKLGGGSSLRLQASCRSGWPCPIFFSSRVRPEIFRGISRKCESTNVVRQSGICRVDRGIGFKVQRPVERFCPGIRPEDRTNERSAVLPLSIWTVLVVGLSVLATIKASRDSGIVLLLLWILAYFLFYKHVWEHQYVMMLPVFILLYHQMKRGMIAVSPGLFWAAFTVIAMPLRLLSSTSLRFSSIRKSHGEHGRACFFHAPKPLAVLALFGILFVRLSNRNETQGAFNRMGAI